MSRRVSDENCICSTEVAGGRWWQSRALAPVRLFLAAGIVFRIDVIELHWCHAVNLDYRLAAGRDVVVHVGIEIGKATRREARHLTLIEVIAHPNLQGPRDHRYVFALGMPMRRDSISRRHL